MKSIDISFLIFWSSIFLVMPSHAYAFSKLIRGLENITSTYLIPLCGAVAGASFILFVTLSFFRQDEYQKKIINILILTAVGGGGLHLVQEVIRFFS